MSLIAIEQGDVQSYLEVEPLDAEVLRRQWIAWNDHSYMQAVRAILNQRIQADLHVSIAWVDDAQEPNPEKKRGHNTDCDNPSKPYISELHNGAFQTDLQTACQKFFHANVGAAVDWLCVVGVCPFVIGTNGLATAWVPSHHQVAICTRQSMPKSQPKFEALWNDAQSCAYGNNSNFGSNILTGKLGQSCDRVRKSRTSAFESRPLNRDNCKKRRTDNIKKCKVQGETRPRRKHHDRDDSDGEQHENHDDSSDCQSSDLDQDNGGSPCDLHVFVPMDICPINRRTIHSRVRTTIPMLQRLRRLDDAYWVMIARQSQPCHFLEPAAANRDQGGDITNALQHTVDGTAGPATDAVLEVISTQMARDAVGAAQMSATFAPERYLTDNLDEPPLSGRAALAHGLMQLPVGYRSTAASHPQLPPNFFDVREEAQSQIAKCFGIDPSEIVGISHESVRSTHPGAGGSAKGVCQSDTKKTRQEEMLDSWSKTLSLWMNFVLNAHVATDSDFCAAMNGSCPIVHIVKKSKQPMVHDLTQLIGAHAMQYIDDQETETLIRASLGLSSRLDKIRKPSSLSPELQRAALCSLFPALVKETEVDASKSPKSKNQNESTGHGADVQAS
jgi:hypothetical protein